MNDLNTTTAAERLIKKVKSKKDSNESYAIFYAGYDNDVLEAVSAIGLGSMEDDNGYDIDVDCGGAPKKVRQGNWIVFDKKASRLEVLSKVDFQSKYTVISASK